MNEPTIMDIADEIRQTETLGEDTPPETPPTPPAAPAAPVDYDRLGQTIASSVATSIAAANRPPEVPLADQMASIDAKIREAADNMDLLVMNQLQNQKFALMQTQMQAVQEQQLRALRNEVGTLKTKNVVSELTRGKEVVANEVVELLSKFGPNAAAEIESNPDLKRLVSLAVDGLAMQKGVKTAPGAPSAQAISATDALPSWADEGMVSNLMSGFGMSRAEALAQMKRTEESYRNGN